MKDVAKRFSVRYFLHLKLIDEDERTYYKQQEITERFNTVKNKTKFEKLVFCISIFL